MNHLEMISLFFKNSDFDFKSKKVFFAVFGWYFTPWNRIRGSAYFLRIRIQEAIIWILSTTFYPENHLFYPIQRRFAQPYISGENKWFSIRGDDFFRKIYTPETICSDPGSALFISGKTICPDILYHKYLFFSDSFPSYLIVLNTWTRARYYIRRPFLSFQGIRLKRSGYPPHSTG